MLVTFISGGVLFALFSSESSQEGFLGEIEIDIDLEYMKFLSNFGKSYVNLEELRKSKSEFQKTLKLIRELNQNSNSSITLGLNFYSDIDFAATKKTILEFSRNDMTRLNESIDIDPNGITDFSINCGSKIRTMGKCYNSDWAFASIAAIELQYCIAT